MKKLAIAATITVGVLGLSACSSDSEVVVESKAGNITQDEYYKELKDRYGEGLLYEMVMLKVLEDNYEVTDEEVEARVNLTKEQQGENFEMYLLQQGIPDEEAFRELTYQKMLQEKLAFEDIKVTDEEVKEKFDTMVENRQVEIKASHILVDEEKTAKEIKQKLDDGADFAELAKEYSKDGSAESGGDLGYFATGKMVKEFEDAAYSLKVGEISEPVKSEHGYHIITVTDIPTLEDKSEDLKLQLSYEKVDQAAFQEKFNGLVEDAKIDVNIDEFKDLFKVEETSAQG